MTRSDGAVLLTGATGFVGMELLARYLERTERPVLTIVRADGDDAARERIDAVLANLFGYRAGQYVDRVTAVAGDLTAPHLGLDHLHWDWLTAEATTIIHCAASVSFGMSLDEARAINVEGTRRMLELAEQAHQVGVLERYAQVSTAYVAGTHAGRFSESDLDVGQSFNNSYEQSKFESEQLVRSHPDLPYTVLRPSIVVGDRNSGWTSAFNVLYWPLRALARGLFPAVPAIPSAPVDVVSIDYVADGIHELCESSGGIRQTYHLTAGVDASTIAEIAELASGYFQQPPPRLLSPAEFASCDHGVARSMIEEGAMYFPYFCVGTEFDDAFTRAHLRPAGISVAPLREYMSRLLDYATWSRWGKHPIARVDAVAEFAGV
jgi:thioester reductase-like protein